MLDANNLANDFLYVTSSARQFEEKAAGPYTNPALRERIKNRIMAGSEGGRPGQWSARKAQLLALRYRKAGGGYKKGKKPTKAQRSLKKWTREKWRTSDGKPALRNGRMRRYLPDKVWGRLTPAQRRATNAKKIRGDRAGRQFVPNTEVAARRSRAVRSRSKGINLSDTKKKVDSTELLKKILGRPVGGISDVDGDGDGFVTGPDGEDNIPAPLGTITPNLPGIAKPDVPQPDDNRDPVPADDEPESPPSPPKNANGKSKFKALLKKIGRRQHPWSDRPEPDQQMQVRIWNDAEELVESVLAERDLTESELAEISSMETRIGEAFEELNSLLKKSRQTNDPEALNRIQYEIQWIKETMHGDLDRVGAVFIGTAPNPDWDMRYPVTESDASEEDVRRLLELSDEIASLRTQSNSLRKKGNEPLRLFAAHSPRANPKEVGYRDGVLKAIIADQMATDMKALGVTDEEANRVLGMLGPIVQDSIRHIKDNYFAQNGREMSPTLLLANEILKQWARTSNDDAMPSILSQLVARQIMPELTGKGDDYFDYESLADMGVLNKDTLTLAMRLADNPLVQKVFGAALQAQWTRTQEQLARHAPDGTVTIWRGFSSEDVAREIAEATGSAFFGESSVESARGSSTSRQISDLVNQASYAYGDAFSLRDSIQNLASQLAQLNLGMRFAIRSYEDEMRKPNPDPKVIESAKRRFATKFEEWEKTNEKYQELRDELEELKNEFDIAQRRLNSIFDGSDEPSHNIDVQLLPLSSTATVPNEAQPFGKGTAQIVIEAKIPVESVLSTTCTGVGCHHEREFVISQPVVPDARAVWKRTNIDSEQISEMTTSDYGDVLALDIEMDGLEPSHAAPDFPPPWEREAKSLGSKYLDKALGKPIGGISDFDGDGDGFLTGPDGQDNIPAPVRAAVPNMPDVPKPDVPKPDDDRDPVPADDEEINVSSESRLRNIMRKIGRRRITWPSRQRSSETAEELAEDAKHLTLQALSAPVDPELLAQHQSLVARMKDLLKVDYKNRWSDLAYRITHPRLTTPEQRREELYLRLGGERGSLIKDTDPVSHEKLSDAELDARADEFIELARQSIEVKKELDKQRMVASPILSLYAAHQGELSVGIPSVQDYRDGVEEGILKAVLVTQIADDMAALGVTEEDARRVLDMLGPIIGESSAKIAKNHLEKTGKEISPILLLADELVKQWARTSNDRAVPSIVSQLVARQVMPGLTDLGDEYFRHEDANLEASRGLGMSDSVLNEATKLASDPLVQKVVGAALQAQWARTQEQLSRFADENGNVRIYRGQASKALHEEILDQNGQDGYLTPFTASDLDEKRDGLIGLLDEAERLEGRNDDIVQQMDNLGEQMDDIISNIESQYEQSGRTVDEYEYSDVIDEIFESQQQLEVLSKRWDELKSDLDDIRKEIDDLQDEYERQRQDMLYAIDDHNVAKDQNFTGHADVQLFPLSSTAVTVGEAENFGNDVHQVIIEAEVPIESVLSSACTGFGCFGEDELVVSYPIIQNTKVSIPSPSKIYGDDFYEDGVDAANSVVHGDLLQTDPFNIIDLDDPMEKPDISGVLDVDQIRGNMPY